MSTTTQSLKNPLMRRFLPLAILATLSVCLVLIVVFEIKTQKDVAREASTQIQDQLSIRQDLLAKSIDEKRRQIRFIYSTPPIQGIVRASENGIDPYDGTPLNLWISRLQTIFVGFLENNPQLAQIRYIGVADNGRELVRVDRSAGNIHVVSGNELQQKDDKEYFQKAKQLKPNEIYVSDISLNQEHGKIEFPYWATYRVAMPVYDQTQTIFGLVVINIFAETVLNSLQQNLADHFLFYLLNSKGDFVVHPNEALLFGTDLQTGENWSTAFVDSNPTHRNNQRAGSPLKEITRRSDQQTIFYQTLDLPISGIDDLRSLRLVVAVPKYHLDDISSYRRSAVLVIITIILVLIVGLISFYQNYINKKLDLSDARSEYEAIISGSSDAILAMDNEGIITRWNPSAELIFGYSEHYIVGKSFFQLIDMKTTNAITPKTIEEVYDGDKKEPFQVKAKTRSGSAIDISVTLSSIYSNDRGVLGVAAIIRDITTQIIIEDQIRNMNLSLEKQVKERTKELEHARNEALSASKAKSEFVANVSHEIRTPMNGVLGMLGLLKKSQLNTQQHDQLMMAEKSALTLTALINDILDVSKMEAGKLELQESEFNIATLISDVFSSMFAGTRNQDLEKILNISRLPQNMVIGDENRLRQILTNLIANAIKFTQQGEIELRADGKVLNDGKVRIVCSVRDTGIGIALDKKEQLFEAFSQEDSSITKRFGGTGLGLTITRQLCQMMGGSIGVTSNIDQGSTFTFDICLQKSAKPEALGNLTNLAGKNSLLIDHNGAHAQAVGDLLELWNSKLTLCEDFAAAQQLLDTSALKAFELIIINLHPTQPVNQVPAFILRYAQQNQTKILALSDQPRNDANSNDHQMLALTKPVTPFSLARALRNHSLLSDTAYSGLNETDSSRNNPALLKYHGRHILVVDDNQINHEVTAGMLEDYSFHLHQAINGEDAIRWLRDATHPVDIILMDCQMPVMDGYSASKAIREGDAGETHKHIPIIAMTANAMSGDRDLCLAAGMSDYLSKPLQVEQLEEKLIQWLNDTPNQSENSGLENLAIWDKEALLLRVKNRQDRFEILINMFLDSADENLKQLSDTIAAEQFDIASKSAHSFKGSSANLGALRLQKICEQLEQATKQGDRSKITESWSQFKPAFDDFVAALKGSLPKASNSA